MSDSRTQVVITGMGLVSPIGCELDEVWQALRAGQSGISPIEGLDCSSLPFRSGGEAKGFTGDIDGYGPLEKKLQRAIKKNMKVMCREIEMSVAASQKALSHAGVGEERDPNRCGCLFGCDYILTRPEEYADGLLSCWEAADAFEIRDWPTHGLGKVNPLWLLKYLPNMPNSHVSIYNDFRGPNNSVTDRDASMHLALLEAKSIIERGAADVMIVGATGTRLHPLRTAQAVLGDPVAAEAENPATMSRPFDQHADGMVLGEGAGAVVLESKAHAESRGAKVWGVLAAGGAAMVSRTAESDHIAESLKISISRALQGAGTLPDQWHVHAQAMGVPATDAQEVAALNTVLAPYSEVPVTAAKSYFGNLGAGSAAVELICSLLAMEHGSLFPVLNLENPVAAIRWKPARDFESAGEAILHYSSTGQGQSASVLVTRSAA